MGKSKYSQFGTHPLINPQFKSDLSKHIATKQVKGGILKGYNLLKKEENILITKPIGPPEKLNEPYDKEELKLVAQLLFDLGYYYEKNPEKEEIEYNLAPEYLGIVGMASDKEQNSLQAAIKKFQRVNGFSLEKCNGYINPDDDTLEKLNSKMVVPLKHYSSSIIKSKEKFYEFQDADHNHLHPILLDFMEDIQWFFNKWMKLFKFGKATGKIKGKINVQLTKIMASNFSNDVLISYASKGYPGDGHKTPTSDHYTGKAIDIVAINGINVSDAKKEFTPPPSLGIPVQFLQMGFTGNEIMEGLLTGPVMALANILNEFKKYEDELSFRWRFTELDTPWHGDKENHQDYIHIAVEPKIKIG